MVVAIHIVKLFVHVSRSHFEGNLKTKRGSHALIKWGEMRGRVKVRERVERARRYGALIKWVGRVG